MTIINRQDWLDGLQVGDTVLHMGRTTKIIGIQDKFDGHLYFVDGHSNWLHDSFIDPIVTQPFDPIAELYRLTTDQVKHWGGLKSIKSVWVHNVRSKLYPIACKMAVADHMSDDQILPTIFVGEDLSLLDGVILNEYGFWKITAEYALQKSAGNGLDRAISEVRADNTRAFTPRIEALTDGPIKASDMALLMAIGCILYDFDSQSYAPNPLWYSKREWEEHLGRLGEGA